MTNAADIAYMNWQAEEEIAIERAVIRGRAYYDGDPFSFLTDRLRLFFELDTNDDLDFNLNVCRPVIHAITERMIVTGFASTDPELSKWLWQLWNKNKMDSKQADIYNDSGVSGAHFVIIEWDNSEKFSAFYPNQRYTSASGINGETLDGTGDGVNVKYQNDDLNQPIEYYSKRWIESYIDAKGNTHTRNRMTLYYKDRIERYQMLAGGWELYNTDDEPSIVYQLDANGNKLETPLGFPVFGFFTPGHRSDIADAIAPQDGINKLLIDALADADIGKSIIALFGAYPTTDGRPAAEDGSNLLDMLPRQVIGSANADGHLDQIDGIDIRPTLEAIEKLMSWTASITGTPASRFASGQVESADAQKERKESLIAKIEARENNWGDVWEDVMLYALKLQNLYGGGIDGTLIDESIEVNTQWKDPQTRNELDTLNGIKIKVESLSISKQQAWREAGYSQEQIEEMMGDMESEAMMRARVAAINTAPPVVDNSFGAIIE
mgnify:CR=1 FL=1